MQLALKSRFGTVPQIGFFMPKISSKYNRLNQETCGAQVPNQSIWFWDK